jgi:hypothetical protein
VRVAENQRLDRPGNKRQQLLIQTCKGWCSSLRTWISSLSADRALNAGRRFRV